MAIEIKTGTNEELVIRFLMDRYPVTDKDIAKELGIRLDEARRRFKYRIIKTSVPLRGYVGEMQVAPTHEGCSVRWWATFHGPDPQSGSADEFDPTDAVKGIFRMGLDNLQAVVGG